MSALESMANILRDPPPPLAFELSEAGIALARNTARMQVEFVPLKPGVLQPSPLHDNVLLPDELAAAVQAAAPMSASRKQRNVALILPDQAARTTVLDFDDFPTDQKEQASLVRFRMRKSLPFDLDSAAVSYYPQARNGKKCDVVVVISPLEIVARYEAPFRAAGMVPGLVTTSSLAALHLIDEKASVVVAKMTGRVLTVLVLDKGQLKLSRSLELLSGTVEEIEADLYPTFVYIEDNLGAKAAKLLLCGFGGMQEEARRTFQDELGVEVDAVLSPLGLAGEFNAGLMGYLKSIAGIH